MSTATLSDNTPLDPDDELLVAYIDGELERKDQSELENRLLEDEKLRARLQQLQSGWELLDDLPDPAPSLKLVESTIELVVADIVKAQPPSVSLWSRFRLPISVGAICLVGMIASFSVASMMKSRDYRRELQDLAIVENLDAYNYGSDLTLMRELAANQDWSKMVIASRKIGDIQIEAIANVSATPIEQREEMVKNLPLEKLTALNSRWERFTRMNEANRNRIRRTAEAVSQQADSEFLLQTIQAYALWRESLQPELRDKIESNDAKERRDAIKQAIDRTQVSISKRSSLKLDDETIAWIYFVLRRISQQRIDSGDKATLNLMERVKGSKDSEFISIWSIVFSGSLRGPGGRRPPTGFLRPGGERPGGERPGGERPGGERPGPLQLHELEMIRLVLPDGALEILDLVSGGDVLNETMALRIWAEEAVRRNSPRRRENSTALERYNDLSPTERDAIDLLPPKEILNALSPEYGRFSR